MTENEWSIDMPSMQQIVIMTVAAVLLISTVEFSQYAMASVETADLDMAEAGNATMMANQTATNGNTADVQFLAIQRAQSGSISEINATTYTLSLSNVSDDTILFSDRPERIVETISTADFIGNWSTGHDSFATDAPNTALIVEGIQTGELDTAIIELFNPIYNANTNTLTYTIAAENATTIDLPYEFGQSTLIVDGFLVA